ncbi:uncharacterized protein BDV14DRAFT_209818 [Aspergillus stella-maris]|uniref:uncharacterized protein n=1 Tax=Aspergillus stella-maris TaxID=1810926 RepID=UPI003CCD4008
MSGVELADDYNIQEAWDKACQAFSRMTKINLTASPKLSVDDVLDEISRKQDEDDKKQNKYRAAKDVISKTGNFIMVLGGIAAQGASMAFAPSSLCFNAISYLIQTGAKYKGIFSSLAELFRRISDVLERCKIYMRLPAEAVDVSLRKIINEELVCFVDICALSIKVMKGSKILTALKVFAFDSDEGISGQLDRLALLVERESQMRATLGFESQKISEKAIVETRDGTKKVTASVDRLLTIEQKKDADSVAKRLLNKIDANLDTPSATFKEIQAIYNRHLSDQVPNTGQWFQNDPLYISWVHSPGPQCSILGLSGDEGFGKSFLFAATVNSLQEMHNAREEGMTRASAAYYGFNQDKKGSSLITTLKVLAWQIAQADMVYRKHLSSAQTIGVNQIGSLCDILFGNFRQADSTFFLLIDGIDQIDKQHLKVLLQVLGEWQTHSTGWSGPNLRILLTGRTEIMSRISDELGDGVSVIDMATKNRDDVLKFIDDRMDKMDILSGSSDQVNSLRGEILEDLAKRTNGDFVNIGLLLDEISTKQRPGEIRDILSRSGEDRTDTIARKIEALNETLNEEDISDLNDILTWVLFAHNPLSIEELEAVLFLKSRERPLRPLAYKIKHQYSSLFQIVAAKVHMVSDSIKDFLCQSSTLDDQDQTSKGPGDVNETERKLKGKAVRVGVEVETAHLRLATACLEVICTPRLPDLDSLLDYAVSCFQEHLASVDHSLTLPRDKIALGPQLVKLLTDTEIIERWWSYSSIRLRVQWIYTDNGVDVLMRWLQDSAVTKNISDEHRKWIKSLSSKTQLDADPLEHVAKFLARYWLQPGPHGIKRLFDIVYGYITKIKNRKDPSIARAAEDLDDHTISAAEILDTANWAQSQVGLNELGYEESRNLARTLRNYGKINEAIERYEHTSTLAKENWKSQCGLAQCYANQNEFNIAIGILEATIQGIQRGEIGKLEELGETLIEMNDVLAIWHRRNGRQDIALEIYEKRFETDPFDYDTTRNLVILLHEQSKYQELLEFLQLLGNMTDVSSGFNLRTKNFHAHCWVDAYNEAITAAAQEDEEFNIILWGYEEALDATKGLLSKAKKAGNVEQEHLELISQVKLMARVATLYRKHSTGNHDREKCAVEHWLRILEIIGTHDRMLLAMQLSAREEFALFCFEKAMQDQDTATLNLEHLDPLEIFRLQDSYPNRLLARYYALQGNSEKAKSILRPYIETSLKLLSDDDPSSDGDAYDEMATLFMFANKDADALAAWSLIIPESDIEATDSSARLEDNGHKLEGPLLDECEAGCGTTWTYADDFYMCKLCERVQFDKQCLDKLRDGTLKQDICRPEHEMLHIPAYDPAELRRIGEGNVKVGEEIMPVVAWLQRVRKEWGIESA